MHVVVTGASGQLGKDLGAVWDGHEVTSFDRAGLDITREAEVIAMVRDLAPDVVVNAAAMTAVDACEDDYDAAHAANALGPWWLARGCDLVGATLVHVSTDYVFSGHSIGRPWTEFDVPAPASAYGRSKLAGETLVRQTLQQHHIVRTAWVFSEHGGNFLSTMLRVGRERGAAMVVDDQVGSPTATRDLAQAIREIAVSGRYGTWHRTNSGACTWFEFAREIFSLAGVDVDLTPCTTEQYPLPAPRPAWSVLSNQHAESAGLMKMPDWRDALRRTLADMGELQSGSSEGGA